MTEFVDRQGQSPLWRLTRPGAGVTSAFSAAIPPLLFGLRLWASVCLALYVAFWLELDNPYWAGASAAIVCQPQLGATLRKGWFRMVGTLVGATMMVVLAACFPQDRIAFLGLLALWGGICAFTATVLRNFASYAAALAGYTAAIIAANALGATGGPSSQIFLIAVWRASEICLGIACATIVLAGTDLGGTRRRLAASLASLAAEIVGQFTRMLALAGPGLPDTEPQRRDLTDRVFALDPTIDQAIGESSQVRYYSRMLHAAFHGLLSALDGWRGVATHLGHLPGHTDRQREKALLRTIPAELRAAQGAGWVASPYALRRAGEKAAQVLQAFPADTPSFRLLADETAKVMAGIVPTLDAIGLLVDAPRGPGPRHGDFRLGVPEWVPAVVNGVRAFVAIGAIELIWLATAWPNGAFAIIFVALVVILLSPRGDLAFLGSIAVAIGAVGTVIGAAIIKFAVLPGLETFPAFCAGLGLYLVPISFAMARSQQPAGMAIFTVMACNFVPLLQPTNEMTYDTSQFYNTALALVAGCGLVALAYALLPPLSPAFRASRLLGLTQRDLRRLSAAPLPPCVTEWEGRIYGRLAALPKQAEPVQREQLLAALSAGAEILHLRQTAPQFGAVDELDAALAAVARGDSATARLCLGRLDGELASNFAEETEAVRARARILVVAEALDQHAAYFDMRARA
jgi:uncharacterized membrane protein YccC